MQKIPLQLPLAMYETKPIGIIKGRSDSAFTLYAGCSKEHVDQLRTYSLDETDEAIQNNTSDRKRFGEGSYEEWYANSRTPFSVVDEATDTLAALIWFGPKPLGAKSMGHLTNDEQNEVLNADTGNEYTIAYRSYHPYRGVGIMKKAVVAATESYLRVFPDVMLWAIVDEENPASVGLAKSLGYKEVGESKDGFVVVVLK